MNIYNSKGMAILIVAAFASLATFTSITFMAVHKNDIELIGAVTGSAQAKNMSRSGINCALSKLQVEGIGALNDFSDDLDIGSYAVTFDGPYAVTQVPDEQKYLITSIGSAKGAVSTSKAEIRVKNPTAMNYMCSAGNDVRIASLLAFAPINGDIHANNDLYLKAIIGILDITGKVSAKGVVKEGSRLHARDGFFGAFLDLLIFINGENEDDAQIFEGDNAPYVIFPAFDYEAYKDAAIESGDYYFGDQVFDGEVLNPGNGIVYVEGDVTFFGECYIEGGIIANNIAVGERNGFNFTMGELYQTYDTNNMRNLIIAKDGDIEILGVFDVEKALVYAKQDLKSLENDAIIEVNGALLAGRDLNMWSFWTVISYTHEELSLAFK